MNNIYLDAQLFAVSLKGWKVHENQFSAYTTFFYMTIQIYYPVSLLVLRRRAYLILKKLYP